jgi:hypothetical protein
LAGILKVTAVQGAQRYGGTYGSGDEVAVFEVDSWPGLVVINLTIGGRDVRAEVSRKAGIELGNLDFQVYPFNVWDSVAKQHQFVGVVQDKAALVDAGTPACTTWMDGIVQVVGGRMVFELDSNGLATTVEVPGVAGGLNRVAEETETWSVVVRFPRICIPQAWLKDI